MPKRKPPHCADAWHFQRCRCTHERQSHTDEEAGRCLERKCICEKFRLDKSKYQETEHVSLR